MTDWLLFGSLLALHRVAPVIRAQFRLDQPRSNRIHANAFWSQFQRVGLRHHNERGFGHAVEQALELGPHAGDGRDIDDGTGAAFAHSRCDELSEAKGALEIDLDHLVKHGFVDFETWRLRHVGGGVVYQNVDAPELVRHSRHHRLDLLASSNMADHRDNSWTNGARHFFQCFRLASTNNHLGAFTCKRLRDGPPNAPASAGDDRNFVC